jgi:uncharacterized protein
MVMSGTSFPDHGSTSPARFDYDRDKPLELKERSMRREAGAVVRDISFQGPAHGEIAAYLVTPEGRPSGPGVLAVHPGPGDRSFFLDDAVRLAGSGVTSLLVEAPWAEGERWGRTMGEAEHDRREFIGIATDLRRAIDVLSSRPEVDPDRLGYLGLSFGALFGGLLAGMDRRMTHYALLSGVSSFTDVAAFNLPQMRGGQLDSYRHALAPLDPARFVGQASPAHLLFIYGTQDPFGREMLAFYADAGSEPKEVVVFDTGHYLNPAARNYAVDWLLRGLSPGHRADGPLGGGV